MKKREGHCEWCERTFFAKTKRGPVASLCSAKCRDSYKKLYQTKYYKQVVKPKLFTERLSDESGPAT